MEHYENKNNNVVTEPSKSSWNPFFVFGIIISIVILVALAIVVIFDISFSKDDTDIVLFEDQIDIQNDIVDISDTLFSGGYDFDQNPVVSCEFPFVSLQDSEEMLVYEPGENIEILWDMCGIGLQTFDSFLLYFYDRASETRVGSVDLVCAGADITSFSEQKITWTVPPYINPGGGPNGCYQGTALDFADDFLLSFGISFARGQYTDEGTFFEIDVSNFVYVPINFADDSVVVEGGDVDFDRANGLDSSVSLVYQERISPQFFQAPAQFANFYRVFSLSCGVDCVSEVVLVDLRTGLLHEAPRSLLLNFRPDSYLFVTSDRLTDAEQNSYEREYRVRWYIFNEDAKQFTVLDTKICDIVQISNADTQYSECIQP